MNKRFSSTWNTLSSVSIKQNGCGNTFVTLWIINHLLCKKFQTSESHSSILASGLNYTIILMKGCCQLHAAISNLMYSLWLWQLLYYFVIVAFSVWRSHSSDRKSAMFGETHLRLIRGCQFSECIDLQAPSCSMTKVKAFTGNK